MIKLLRNYPYDNNYDYIKLFTTKTEQNSFFNKFTYTTINEGDDEGYIRVGQSFIVEINYDELVFEGVNYVIWNNGHKDLFCFIVKKEYVDEYNTRLHYEIDVLNTFCFDISIKKSFIERKKCTLSEICDYDEGIDIGEHSIDGTTQATLTKEYRYLAMFNGIKEQLPIFENGKITNVINTPANTFKPLTLIDGIQYPVLFMELQDSYPEPTYIEIPTGGGGSGGNWEEGQVSGDGYRFLKGYEGYGVYGYQDSGGYWTICYGITRHGEEGVYNEMVAMEPVPEEVGAQRSYTLLQENYGSKIVKACKDMGITQQQQFDALLDLAYNSGYGSITGSNELTNAIRKNPTNESYIRPIWESYKTNGGLAGLVKRRKAECDIYFQGIYEKRDILKIMANGSYNGKVTENDGNGWLPS